MRSPLIDPIATPLGYALLAVGAALIVLPGPGIPFLLGGLALLARRRPWARRARRRLVLRVAAALGRRGGRGGATRSPRPRRQERAAGGA